MLVSLEPLVELRVKLYSQSFVLDFEIFSTGAVVLSILIGFLLVLPGLVMAVFTQVFVDQILVENRTDWLRSLLLGILFNIFY